MAAPRAVLLALLPFALAHFLCWGVGCFCAWLGRGRVSRKQAAANAAAVPPAVELSGKITSTSDAACKSSTDDGSERLQTVDLEAAAPPTVGS